MMGIKVTSFCLNMNGFDKEQMRTYKSSPKVLPITSNTAEESTKQSNIYCLLLELLLRVWLTRKCTDEKPRK